MWVGAYIKNEATLRKGAYLVPHYGPQPKPRTQKGHWLTVKKEFKVQLLHMKKNRLTHTLTALHQQHKWEKKRKGKGRNHYIKSTE